MKQGEKRVARKCTKEEKKEGCKKRGEGAEEWTSGLCEWMEVVEGDGVRWACECSGWLLVLFRA